jgi:hypothetical protein
MADDTTQEGKGQAQVEPYVAYKTFNGFTHSLKASIPARIDRSVMSTYSGAVQAQLLHALKYFDLIAPTGQPKPMLHQLVNSEGEQRKAVLQQIVRASYPKLFAQGFDLTKATTNLLAEQFTASGDTVRKCIGFLLPLLKEAGIPISPHIKGPPKRSSNGAKRRKPAAEVLAPPPPPPPPAAAPQQQPGWTEMLLSKFPTFDPAWPEDVKKQWFTSFEALMKSGPAAKEKP